MDWQNQSNNNLGGSNNYSGRDTTVDALISTMQRVQVLSESNDDLRSKIAKQEEQIRKYDDLLNRSDSAMIDHEKRLGEMDEKYKVMESDLKNTRDKTLEPLAVFVGLFTFVSVGFNIFANVKDTSLWVSLLLIIAGIMIIFASLVIHAGSLATKENNRRYWTGSLIGAGTVILLAGTGIHLVTDSRTTDDMSQSAVKVELPAETKDAMPINTNEEKTPE